MVLCQVCTEFSGLRDIQSVRESARASDAKVVVCRTFQSLLYLAFALYEDANLTGGGKKTFVCMCAACVRVFKDFECFTSVFLN